MAWDVIRSTDDEDKYDIVKLQEISFPGEGKEKYKISNWEEVENILK